MRNLIFISVFSLLAIMSCKKDDDASSHPLEYTIWESVAIGDEIYQFKFSSATSCSYVTFPVGGDPYYYLWTGGLGYAVEGQNINILDWRDIDGNPTSSEVWLKGYFSEDVMYLANDTLDLELRKLK